MSTYCSIQSTIADAVNSKKGHLARSSGYSTITDIVNKGVRTSGGLAAVASFNV